MARWINCPLCGKKIDTLNNTAGDVIEQNGKKLFVCAECKQHAGLSKDDYEKELEANNRRDEYEKELEAKNRRNEEYHRKLDEIIISTGDIRREYEILDVIHKYVDPFDFANAILWLKDQAYKLGADAIVYLEFDTVVYSTYEPSKRGLNRALSQFAEEHIALNAYGTAIRFI